MSEIREWLEVHIQSIFDADVAAYHATTVEDLTIYEWHVTPHRIEGLPFHDFMLAEAGREDSAALALEPSAHTSNPVEDERVRFDLANYREQVYGDTAICSYTMLISRGTRSGVRVTSYNESRVLIRFEAGWRVVHVHKSPSWSAPFQPPV
jgi:Calcium/calmodulin dependent protein kinase II association domain